MILWLACSLVFAGIGFVPASRATRPVLRWAFCVRRSCEVLAKRHYIRMMVIGHYQTEIEVQKFLNKYKSAE